MNKEKLNSIATDLSKPPKGILAADESTNTITKRFDSINVKSNAENRRKYRELLFSSANLNKYISGVILYDETVYQSTNDGVNFPQYLKNLGIIPGIKVDTGAVPIEKNSPEKITEGLDGLQKRLEEYNSQNLEFTKWRAIIDIDTNNNIPTEYSIELNAHSLSRYARIVQDYEMVPIVEPEILMDGAHDIETCYKITSNVLKKVFEALNKQNVYLGGILLKPNMIIAGKNSTKQASTDEVATMTLKCLNENVPKDVPGIVFLSGGQSNELATQHLNKMNKDSKDSHWNISFSYGRALQQPSLSGWMGSDSNTERAQKELLKRSKLNSDATLAKYSIEDENSQL
jgi:fructose-bisphosphate aldolase class I